MNTRRLGVRNRLATYAAHAREHGKINRSDVQRLGEVSVPQASADIAMLIEDYPELNLRYDKSAKTYRTNTSGEPDTMKQHPKPNTTPTANDNKRRMREFIAGVDDEYVALQEQVHAISARASRMEVDAHIAAGFTREEAITLVARK